MASEDSDIFSAQISLLYKQQRSLIAAIFFASTTLSFILWGQVDQQKIITWLISVYTYALVLIIRLWLYHYKNNLLSVKGWAINNIITYFISGCLWGSVPLLFLDFSAPAYTSIIILTVIGTSLGNVASASVYPFSYAAYAIPCMLLTILALLLESAQGSNLLALLCFGFLILSLSSSKNIYQTIKDSILLRIQHVDLLQQLTQEKENAEHANVSKSNFLAAASHDLRQPMHALSIFSDALSNVQDTSDNVKHLSEKINRCVNGLDLLFDSLLDISKLDAGTVEVNKEHYDIELQCENLISNFKPLARKKNINLQLLASRNTDNFIVNSDSILCERILSNLLSNALNYTHQGQITVELEKTDQRIKISITDTGKGINQDDLAKIFDEYYQLYNPERDRNKGLGLGLSICQKLATLLETDINVESIINQGSCFSFALPQGSIQNIQPPNATPIPAIEKFLQDKSLMVIDDDEDILEAMRTLLLQWRCSEIFCVTDKYTACKIIEDGKTPDIIISDYRLKNNQNGIEAINAICKASTTNIPALLISGDTGASTMKKIKSSGFMLLSKPVAPAKLKIAIKSLLEN